MSADYNINNNNNNGGGPPPLNLMMTYYDGDDLSSTTAAMIILFGSIIFATIGMTIRVWNHGDKRGKLTNVFRIWLIQIDEIHLTLVHHIIWHK